MATLVGSATRDFGAYQTRDLTPQVHMIQGILPQCTEDMVCEALIQTGEDVEKAMELLLSKIAERESPSKKKALQQQQLAQAEQEAALQEAALLASQPQKLAQQYGGGSEGGLGLANKAGDQFGGSGAGGVANQAVDGEPASGTSDYIAAAVGISAGGGRNAGNANAQLQGGRGGNLKAGGNNKAEIDSTTTGSKEPEEPVVEEVYDPQPVVPEFSHFLQLVQVDRAPSRAEKDLLKLRKKMREIEQIEKKLENGEKVDALQMPKLEKKGELTFELKKTEETVNGQLKVDAEALREKHIADEWVRIEAEKAERKRLEEERREQERLRLEEERRLAEEEARRKAEEEEARRKAEAEALERRKQQEEEQRRIREEQERLRKQQQEEQAERLRQSQQKGNWAGVATAGAWQQPAEQRPAYGGKKGGSLYKGTKDHYSKPAQPQVLGQPQQAPQQVQQEQQPAYGGQQQGTGDQSSGGYQGYHAQQPYQQSWGQQQQPPPQRQPSAERYQQQAAEKGAEDKVGEVEPSDDWGMALGDSSVLAQQKSVYTQPQTSMDGGKNLRTMMMNDGGKGDMKGNSEGTGKGWNKMGQSNMDNNWRAGDRNNVQGGPGGNSYGGGPGGNNQSNGGGGGKKGGKNTGKGKGSKNGGAGKGGFNGKPRMDQGPGAMSGGAGY